MFKKLFFSSEEEIRYVCDVCDKVFARKVTLKKHKEEHDNPHVEFGESEEEFDYTTDSPKKPKKRKVSIIIPKLEYLKDDVNISNTTTNIEYF